jgi:hypothetical protein
LEAQNSPIDFTLRLSIASSARCVPLRRHRNNSRTPGKMSRSSAAGLSMESSFHPTAPGVRYARTDMGSAYRWDVAANRWQPMLDWVPYKDLNLMGIESIAVDPEDPKRVYLACGTYTNAHTPNGAILRSDDSGHTFQRTDVPFKFGGNEDGRGNGERLAVDPHDGRILFLGTRHDGLWRSQNRGATWARVTGFPDVTEAIPPPPSPISGETPEQRWRRMPVRGSGIVFVKFLSPPNAQAAPISATQTIYAGVSLMGRPNLFVSSLTPAQPGTKFLAHRSNIAPPAPRFRAMDSSTSLTAQRPAHRA